MGLWFRVWGNRLVDGVMKIERFKDIEAWQLARGLTNQVCALTKKPASAMHNIAEGVDAGSNAEFIEPVTFEPMPAEMKR